jgi:cellulose synthase/poly-beta-1,6-N-acetylglucosamine synthase-like glycosyltransferase
VTKVAIIIPAHNEERALEGSLRALAAQDYAGEVEVVVAANGCSDDTAAVARRSVSQMPLGWTVTVLELAKAEKWAALNVADAHVEAEIRVYLDADIVLDPSAVKELATALDVDGPYLVQPRLVAAAIADAAIGVDSFVKVWSSLPYVRNEVLGVGCYAVNAAGRALWGEFPPFGADDTFVRLRFGNDQKTVVRSATMTVSFPTSLTELVRVRARWCRLGREVRRAEDALPEGERGRWLRALSFAAKRPRLWVDSWIFMAIWACAMLLSFAPNRESSWARASSSPARA